MANFYKLTIKDIHKETDKAVSITFSIPKHLKETFGFKAGQYITLKAEINGKELRRDYSLCCTPNSGVLKVAVKEVKEGAFSIYANQYLKIGDVLEVAAPNGRFTFEPSSYNNTTIAAFAAGSGITPIMGIIKTVLESSNNSFILVYGNKTPQDTLFLNEIAALQSTYKERFQVQLVFSKSETPEALFGRIDSSIVNFIIKNKYKNVRIDAFYLCGPEQMIKTVSTALTDNGISDTSIFFELFTTSTAEVPEMDSSVSFGSTKITILVDDEETTFEMSQKKSILEAALDKNIDAPYSCQGGICSSCVARLVEGKANMRQNNILTDSELAEGLILTCQAHPTTTTLFIDYDDV